jgi:hypothetical protein
MLLSRRSALRAIAAFVSVFAIFGRRGKPTLVPPSLEHPEESVAAVNAWLVQHGITLKKLAQADGGLGRATLDMKASFNDDPVVNAGGLLLPTGFCRYCLENGTV